MIGDNRLLKIELFQQVPSKLVGAAYVPDYDYTMTIGENSTITSTSNSSLNFLMEDKCDFSISSSNDPTEVSIYQVSGPTPQYYLLKKTRNAISAGIKTQTFTFGAPTQFPTININDNNNNNKRNHGTVSAGSVKAMAATLSGDVKTYIYIYIEREIYR